MSENAGEATSANVGSPPAGGSGGERRHRRGSVDLAGIWSRTCRVLEIVVRWVGTLLSLLMVAHVVLAVGGANPDNAITRFVAEWAKPLALGFSDLFAPADPSLAVLVNYGIAAVFYLFATSIAVRIIRSLS